MTKSIVNKLARQELLDMVPYQSARRLQKAAGGTQAFNQKIWLNANEASGIGEYQLSADCINRYPDFQPDELINNYAEYAKLDTSQVLATRGADEGIELIIRTFCIAYQDSILICPPTYGMYAISAENHGADIVKVSLVDNQLNVEGIIQAQNDDSNNIKVIFLCSPGNPTGNRLPAEQIKAVLEACSESTMVVVDEAYIEFCPETSVSTWLSDFPNLIILRTLSKAFALAGLRCGFTLASSEVITMLSKVIAPYPISAPVAEIASQALIPSNVTNMQQRVNDINQQKQQIITWLNQQPWCEQVFASDANFVLFKTQYKDHIFQGLAKQGILIRDQSKQQQLENCLRISIGTEQELAIVKQAINELMTSQSK